MTNKNRQSEYVTKSDLKEELGVFKIEVHEIVNEAIDGLGRILANNFNSIYHRLDTIESTMATKQDILNLYDKTVSNDRFNELTGRVIVLEKK